MLVVALLPLLALAAAAAVPQAPPGRADVDQLDQAALQQAFTALKSGYIRPDAFSYDEINRAALDGLLRRLQFGAELVPAAGQPSTPGTPPLGFQAERLSPRAGYIRLASFTAEELPLVDEWLGTFQAEPAPAPALILDLRVPCAASALDAAARMLDRFVSPNTILFKVQRPREDRPRLYVSEVTDVRWKGGLVVLIDAESCSAAELIAAVLRRERGAFLVGSPTRGLTVEYDQVPLSKAVHLRFAVAEIVLGDGTSLFRRGLAPHFAVNTEPGRKHRVFAASALRSGKADAAPEALTRFLLDRARPRMNEASLVHRTDPELDYYVARARGERTTYDQAPLQDETLQRALDLLTTLEFVHSPPPQGAGPGAAAPPVPSPKPGADPKANPAAPALPPG